MLYYYRKFTYNSVPQESTVKSLISEEVSEIWHHYSRLSLWLCGKSGKRSTFYGGDEELNNDLDLNQVSTLCVIDMWTF